MGNRAVVKFVNDNETHGVYLHWNGGPESVLAFLQVMEDRDWTRMDYASARFVGVVVEFFDATGNDSGHSVGIVENPSDWAGGCDNGLYTVSRSKRGGWDVQHKSRPISCTDLVGSDRKQFDGIVEVLVNLRSLRRKAAREVAAPDLLAAAKAAYAREHGADELLATAIAKAEGRS